MNLFARAPPVSRIDSTAHALGDQDLFQAVGVDQIKMQSVDEMRPKIACEDATKVNRLFGVYVVCA